MKKRNYYRREPMPFRDWAYITDPEVWREKAEARRTTMENLGYKLCPRCSGKWLAMDDGKRQRDCRNKIMHGQDGSRPWIYPIDCFHKPEKLETCRVVAPKHKKRYG